MRWCHTTTANHFRALLPSLPCATPARTCARTRSNPRHPNLDHCSVGHLPDRKFVNEQSSRGDRDIPRPGSLAIVRPAHSFTPGEGFMDPSNCSVFGEAAQRVVKRRRSRDRIDLMLLGRRLAPAAVLCNLFQQSALGLEVCDRLDPVCQGRQLRTVRPMQQQGSASVGMRCAQPTGGGAASSLGYGGHPGGRSRLLP